MMDAIELLRTMRAVRRFSPEPIPRDVLLDILETSRWTGSAKNTQPWELLVMRDRETLQEVANLAPLGAHVAGAQAAIALIMNRPTAGFDEGRLAQTLMLAAWARGVGSCIASIFPEENVEGAKALLGVPADLTLRTVISLGYPADPDALSLSASARRGDAVPTIPIGRKPLEELVSWERFSNRVEPA
jgi:nitroreductase